MQASVLLRSLNTCTRTHFAKRTATPARLTATPRLTIRSAHQPNQPNQQPSSKQVDKPQPLSSSSGRAPLSASENSSAPPLLPSEHTLGLWQHMDAVCFDVDCAVTRENSLNLLARWKGVPVEVVSSEQAADGGGDETAAKEEKRCEEKRLSALDCTPTDIQRFLIDNPPSSQLVQGVEDLIPALRARGVAVFLISGGIREIVLPIAEHLGVPAKNVFCNSGSWQLDDAGSPLKLQGFDKTSQGKPQAIARIRQQFPYNNVVMIGDGISHPEAAEETGGADIFICYGSRPCRADWFVQSYDDLIKALKHYKVACVGSGAWACAAVRMVAQSTAEAAKSPVSPFVPEVTMWVHEEEFEGKKLTEIINDSHKNPAYLAGVDLGENVVANDSLIESVRGADAIIFCTPHQFAHSICKQLAAAKVVDKGVKAISLTKGMRVRSDGPQLISQMISRTLGINCSVLMGANIAGDVAREELSEAVIAYNDRESGALWRQLFQRPYFSINLLADDVIGAEMCGTLKNIVAVGAGIGDGLSIGANSKASILRQGLAEMRQFCKLISPSVREDTFFEPCGVADVIASSYAGRNRRVAEAWCRRRMSGDDLVSFQDLERNMLNGQKLQGVLTSDEVQEILRTRGWELQFPLFTTINRIIHGEVPVDMILRYREAVSMPNMPQ